MDRRYGAPLSSRSLTKSLFLKKFDYIRDALRLQLSLTCSQREVVLRMLRLYAYYGSVYCKASQITDNPGCRSGTFWRTIRILESQGLIQVVNRYLFRPHAQISNLYRLDKLIILIVHYLACHGVPFIEACLRPYLSTTASEFMAMIDWPPDRTRAPETG